MTQRQAYFTSWTPRETRESYNQEEKTVDYDIYCIPLTVAGSPSDIFQWFKALFTLAKSDKPDETVPFTLNSLGIPKLQCAAGIWNTVGDDVLCETDSIHSEEQLLQWLCQHFYFERYGQVNEFALRIGTTMEFDYEFAFFYPEALLEGNQEENLGPYLPKTLVLNLDGTVSKTCDSIRYSAYL